MTIIEVGDIEFQANSGYDDPGLPIRIWRSAVRAQGDASGGNRVAQINLKAAGVPPGNVFSLEQISASDQAVAETGDLHMTAAGMQLWNPSLEVMEYAFPMFEIDQTTTLVIRPEAFPRAIWIGRGADAGTAGTLSFSKDNANGDGLLVAVTGYMWAPRSISAGGGFRRPIDGQFSN